jgi:thymidylate kinase
MVHAKKMATPRPLLIAFSGLDAAGKSTQIALLMEHLRRNGHRPIYLWTRGGYTPLFERLKALLRRLPGRPVPPSGPSAQRAHALRKGWLRRLWLVIALLDLLCLYGVRIRWWHWRGRTVICDRYLWDTLIDFRLNFPQEAIERSWLWRLLALASPRPDVSLALLVPVAESIRRSDAKGEPFRDPPATLAARLAQYESLAAERHWNILDGRRPIDDLHAAIVSIVAGAAAPRRALPRRSAEESPTVLR